MQPIDYSLDVQSPFQAALQGFQAGAGVRQVMDQRAQLELQRQQQLQMQQDIGRVTANPNAGARDYAALTMKYPALKDQFKQSWDMIGKEQQASRLDLMTRAYSALSTGRADIAERLMRDRAEAMRNSGAPEQDVKAQEMWADLIKASPEQARHVGGLMLSSVMDADKFAETFGKIGGEARAADMAPSALAASEANAQTAKVKAKYANSAAILDLEKAGWDIKKIAADIDLSREANRIAAMNAATSRETNALKRQELALKVQEAQQKLDEKVREKASTAQAGATSIDNMLNTIERIKTNPNLNDVLGGIEGRMPAVADDSVDAIALIETLGSQAFLAQIPNIKGMGALSNAEGEKLQAALQNISRTQSEKQFRANLDEAARLLNKGRENLSRSTGVPLGKPDTPAAPGARPPLSSFNRGAGGAGGSY